VDARDVIETLALILAAGLVSELVATALRLPRMVVLLAAGVVLGPDVAGVLEVELDAIGVQLLLTFGVSFILFHGGLNASLDVLSRVGVGLGLLAVPGVVLTALVVGAVASFAFGIPFEAGFLVGAVVAPTDPAILIPLFERLRVRPKVSQTIVAESALNDATGAVLALAVAAHIVEGGGSLAAPLADFVIELALSVGLGLAFGFLLALVLSDRPVGIWRQSPAVAVAALIAAAYVSIDTAGGSGYMGAFIAGVIAGNARHFGLRAAEEHERELEFASERVTDVVVLFVFVVVGASLPLGDMAENALAGLAVVAALIALARPVTALACLLPDRRGAWEGREIAFLAWTRETGVVPISLAGILLAEGVRYETEIVTVVAFAIVVTLAVQTTTKGWLARRLDLLEPEGVP
jgi:potassium/hydrogen antiporter